MENQTFSFNWLYLMLIPVIVGVVVYILRDFISQHLFKNSRQKEKVEEAIKIDKVKKTFDILDHLKGFVDRIEKLTDKYAPILIDYLELKRQFDFEDYRKEGLTTFGTIKEFCETNVNKIDDSLRTKVMDYITVFKDDIVFVMKNMKNFDVKRAEKNRKNYLKQVKQAQVKTKESIEDLRKEIKSRLEI